MKEITLKEFKDLEFKAKFSGKKIDISKYKIIDKTLEKKNNPKEEIVPDKQQKIISALVKFQKCIPELEGDLNIENKTMKVVDEMLTEAMSSDCSSKKLKDISNAIDYLNKIYNL